VRWPGSGAKAGPAAKARPAAKSRPSLKDAASAAYALGWSAVCRLPESWAAAAFKFLRRHRMASAGSPGPGARRNLRRVLGPTATGKELRALSRASMQSYARYWLEIFRLPVMPTERLVGGMVETRCGRRAAIS